MSIVRKHFSHTIVPTAMLRSSLSWEAKGFLAFLMSQPDNWTMEVEDFGEVHQIVNELKKAGYMSADGEVNVD